MKSISCLKVIFAAGMALMCAAAASGQEAAAAKGGVADDWSHHRLIFSNPGTAEEAIRNGWYGRWLEIENDPRYRLQERKRNFRGYGLRRVRGGTDLGARRIAGADGGNGRAGSG